MKMKFILAFAVVALLGLSIAAVAYTRTTTATKASSCCPKSSESCPMKAKGETVAEKADCWDNCDCCKGDSCPMKKKTSASAAASTETGEAKSCDCSCCNHDKAKSGDSSV